MAWLDAYLEERHSRIEVVRDGIGNYRVTQRAVRRHGKPVGSRVAKVVKRPTTFITAHLDHPAFVVTGRATAATHGGANVELEFRGGVHSQYFKGARICIFDSGGRPHRARIHSLDSQSVPYKRVQARLSGVGSGASIARGDIGRWDLPRAGIFKRPIGPGKKPIRVLETHACDDLAAVAAACSAFDQLLRAGDAPHVGLLFTVAEEVGFVGAIHAARTDFVPRSSRLICLENSRSFPHDSPIGAGAILRVGDRMSVFSPNLTNSLSELFAKHAKTHPEFRFQRKLMPGGACEATAFSAYGFDSTCICLPLGNYHNMCNIDGVLAGNKRALVGSEFIAVEDYHGMIAMLLMAARATTDSWIATTRSTMERLHTEGMKAITRVAMRR